MAISEASKPQCHPTSGVIEDPAGDGPEGRTARTSGSVRPTAAAPLAPAAGGGAQRPDEAAAWRAAAAESVFDRKLTLLGFLLHSATQVVSLMAWSSLPLSEKTQRLGSIVFAASMWVLPGVAPMQYLRWRKEVLILYRLAFFAFPLLRKARGIQHVLDDASQPGARGAVKDLTRIIWGGRIMAVVMACMLNPLPLIPLVPHLLLQVYTVAMVRSNGTLCSTPLMSDPLTVQRIHTFHSTLHLLAFALPGGVGQSMFPLLERTPHRQECECESFLSFLFYTVGLLLPMWVLVKTEPPTSLRAWEERSCAVEGQQPRRGLLSRLEATAEGALRQLCGRSWLAGEAPQEGRDDVMWAARGLDPAQRGRRRLRLQGWERVLAWWMVLALLWAICIAVHTG